MTLGETSRGKPIIWLGGAGLALTLLGGCSTSGAEPPTSSQAANVNYPVAGYATPGSAQTMIADGVFVERMPVSDAVFAQQALTIAAGEIAMARIAAQRGSVPDIRSYADGVLGAHRAAAAHFDSLALAQGRVVDWPLNRADEAAVTQLLRLDGAEFDHLYVQETIRAHEAATALLAGQAEGTGNTAALARGALPAVQEDLAQARDLQMRL